MARTVLRDHSDAAQASPSTQWLADIERTRNKMGEEKHEIIWGLSVPVGGILLCELRLFVSVNPRQEQVVVGPKLLGKVLKFLHVD